MKAKCRWQLVCTAGLGLALASLTGCQTWVAGMTLPSGHYLEHPPQYIPPSPPFPLPRELAEMQGAGPGVVAPSPPPPAPITPAPVP